MKDFRQSPARMNRRVNSGCRIQIEGFTEASEALNPIRSLGRRALLLHFFTRSGNGYHEMFASP